MTKVAKPQTHNHTPFTLKQIEGFPLLGTTVNNWRQRDITLYQHPDKSDCVISVGVTFDNSMIVVETEPKADWTVALDYAARGKVYVSE